MLQEWTIQARTDRCDVTGQPFTDGEFFYTLLYRDQARHPFAPRRFGRGLAAVESRQDRAAPVLVLAVEIRPAVPAREPEAIPKADAETRLRRFLAENRPEHARAAYILALMLERKRVLRPTDAQQDEDGWPAAACFTNTPRRARRSWSPIQACGSINWRKSSGRSGNC